jgi:hypothetical protein
VRDRYQTVKRGCNVDSRDASSLDAVGLFSSLSHVYEQDSKYGRNNLSRYFLQLVETDWLANNLSASIFRAEDGGNISEDNYLHC